MKIRKNLLKHRNLNNLTQREVSSIIKISERHYRKLESGTSNGSISLWNKLAKYFNTTIDDLLEQDVKENN